MTEKKELPLVRLADTGEMVLPIWADLGDADLSQDKDLAKMLARVIEQWLFEDEDPILN
ncbi:MAG: hypothetical protein ACOX87_04915 [Chloroflexota bacterium]